MRILKHAKTGVVAIAAAAWLAMGGLATAAFPNFSDCPTGLPAGSGCINIKALSGEMVIKGFEVPLGDSIEIRGALREPEGTFIPPVGTNGFFAESVNVPGGVLGIELPISLNLVAATAKLAGPPSSIQVNPQTLEIRMPLKVHLSNPLIGDDCHIGSNRNPVMTHLITGTTNPPPPNRPISGHVGRLGFGEDYLLLSGNLNVENSYSIPGASTCGFLGILNPLINLKLGLPSAGGNNSLAIESDAAIKPIV